MARRKADGGYEFTGRENRAILALVRYMVAVQWVLVVVAVLAGLAGAVQLRTAWPVGVAAVATAVVNMVLAGFTFRAVGSFRLIVDTRGEDVDHLMNALLALKGVYAVQLCGFTVQVVAAALQLAAGRA